MEFCKWSLRRIYKGSPQTLQKGFIGKAGLSRRFTGKFMMWLKRPLGLRDSSHQKELRDAVFLKGRFYFCSLRDVSLDRESNPRPCPYQGHALPTELSRH